MIKEVIDKLLEGKDLTEIQMIDTMNKIMEGKVSHIQIATFLTALRIKGESISEITGGARVMREKSIKLDLDHIFTVDTCGTGGDGANTYNISTASAFVLAAGGVSVVKHGNRSVSSQSGSADVLEELGINISISPKKVKECVEKINLGFLFAPTFHSAMKYVAVTRKELGFRTIFNILGPLTNPARANAQLLGVFDGDISELMAESMKQLGVEHLLVVHGMDKLDEITVTDRTKVTELKDGKLSSYYIEPEDFGIARSDKKELEGGTPKENAQIILDIFSGRLGGAKKDILLLNAGAGLYLGKKVDSIKEGVELARNIIDSGKAMEKLEALRRNTNLE